MLVEVESIIPDVPFRWWLCDFRNVVTVIYKLSLRFELWTL